MTQVKHVLGISGGKDSAALAIYLNQRHPDLDVHYYTCDTGKELKETYELIDRLEVFLGKEIEQLKAVSSDVDPFDHFLSIYGGYLPSTRSRWCTKNLKLKPFEEYVAGDEPVISYVGIRGDEDREGYISKKSNIQSIFPFRRNIWSEDVIRKLLNNAELDNLLKFYEEQARPDQFESIQEDVVRRLTSNYTYKEKLDDLLNYDTTLFNKVVFAFLKTTDYPLSKVDHFPLIENEDNLTRKDIFRILEDSGVGIPSYYNKREYQVDIEGELKTGYYSRSRSGCFFCFYQQKIEWVWLYENHPDLFRQAKEYEKEGFSWQQGETLTDIEKPERRESIKREHYLRMQRKKAKYQSPLLADVLTNSSQDNFEINWEDVEGEGCAACFI